MLDLINVSKSYDNRLILDNITYSFPSSGLFVLCGENGAGKSTLLSIISGHDSSFNGKIKFSGTEITNKNRNHYSNQRISYLSQISLVFDDEKVIDDFLLPFEQKDKDKAIEILTSLGLKENINQSCSSLSAGEKQRLCFGQILYNLKDIILLDESFANLDFESQDILYKKLLEIAKNHLVIFVTHEDLPEYLNKQSIRLSLSSGRLSGEEIKEDKVDFSNNKDDKNYRFEDVKFSLSSYKKSHILVFLIFMILTLVSTLFLSFGYSYDEKFIVNSKTHLVESVIYKRYEEKASQHFASSSPIFISSSNGYKGESLNAIETSYVQRIDNHYSPVYSAGNSFSGVFEYNPSFFKQGELIIQSGTLPTNSEEVIISDVCASHISSPLNRKITFLYKSYTIVGIYASKNADELTKKYSNIDLINQDIHYYSRICYAYMIETIFCGGNSNKNTKVYLNSDVNRENFLNNDTSKLNGAGASRRFIFYAPLLVDKNGNYRFHLFENYTANFGFGYTFLTLIGIFIPIFAVAFYSRYKRQYLLLRIMGTRRDKLTRGNLIAFSLSSLIGVLAGFFLTLALPIMNLIYNNLLGTSGVSYFSTDISFYLFQLGGWLAFSLFMLVTIYKFLCPKNFNRTINKIKEK